jgi:hypothetical protein
MLQLWSCDVRPEELPKMQNDRYVWIYSRPNSKVSYHRRVTSWMLINLESNMPELQRDRESFSLFGLVLREPSVRDHFEMRQNCCQNNLKEVKE